MADTLHASASLPAHSNRIGSHNQSLIATTPSTLLPSFAAFREHADRSEKLAGRNTATMATRSPCSRCSKVELILKEVAIAASELDDIVQSYCNKNPIRAVNVPTDEPSRTAHWILDRLRRSKFDLQEACRRSSSLVQMQQQNNADGLLTRRTSPPTPFKRPAEPWERDDLQGAKRFQSGSSVEHKYQLANREPSIYSAKDHRLGNCSPPADSTSGSAPSRLTSPSFGGGGNHRTLPSPSSLGYPPSGAPSLPTSNSTQSVSSPAISWQQTSTLHSASSSSATSQHIADLQHQVTLKSLALQTLQSEYASLLQKLQRERVKSQTIERKTSAADQEVNDLTGKNEDLSEQIKTLEAQLEESERKRDHQRLEAAREKDQWGRMLEMSGRLQNKLDAERQRLLEEKAYLAQRVAIFEDQGLHRAHEHGKRESDQQPDRDDYQSLRPAHQPVLKADSVVVKSTTHTTYAAPSQDQTTTGHEQEVSTLRVRVNALRTTLEEVRRHNEVLEATARGFLEQTGLLMGNVSRALDHDLSRDASKGHVDETAHNEKTRRWTFGPAKGLLQQETSFAPDNPRPHPTLEIIKDGKRSLAHIAEESRADSTRPRESSFDVPPTKSSPEELIEALGPVPITLPNFQYAPPIPSWTPMAPSRQSDKTARPVSALAPHAEARNTPAGYAGHHRPATTSPQSHHSTPTGNRESSSPEIGLHPPLIHRGELEPSMTGSSTTQAVHTTTNGFHDSTYRAHNRNNEWMPPPPPKPETTSAAPTASHA